jgi:Uma2 family endonuclease
MTLSPIHPQADPWTLEDLDRLPHGYFYEIIDGSLLLSPPLDARQRLAGQIENALPAHLDVLSPSGVDVGASFLVPDIAAVHVSAIEAGRSRFVPADVVLVVEFAVPSKAGMARREKPVRYAEVGIPHFWRVELEGGRAPYIVRHGLRDGSYVELGTVYSEEETTVDIGFPVTLRPAELTGRRRV